MGKKKKKEKDFPKVKLKVGKKLKKTTSTDTRIQAKNVVLIEQLTKGENVNYVSHRGLSLDELCRQLGHYNMNVRRDSVIGVRQLLSSHPELIPKHLHTLIPAVGRLIACDKSDSAFHAQLRALLELLCVTTAASTMSSHFTLLLAHTLRALTHLRMGVRLFALSILTLLMRTYPELCRSSADLFDSFVYLLNGQRIPANKALLIDALTAFLRSFSFEQCSTIGPRQVASFSIRNKQMSRIDITPTTRPMIDFCVLGTQPQHLNSPLDSADKLLEVLSGIFSLFVMNTMDEGSLSMESEWAAIFAMLSKVLSRVRTINTAAHFEEELKKVSSGVNAMLKKGNLSRRMRTSLQSLKLP